MVSHNSHYERIFEGKTTKEKHDLVKHELYNIHKRIVFAADRLVKYRDSMDVVECPNHSALLGEEARIVEFHAGAYKRFAVLCNGYLELLLLTKSIESLEYIFIQYISMDHLQERAHMGEVPSGPATTGASRPPATPTEGVPEGPAKDAEWLQKLMKSFKGGDM